MKKVKKDEWDKINYDNISAEENETIRIARRKGYADFYPMFPSWEDQGINTLNGAKKFLNEN